MSAQKPTVASLAGEVAALQDGLAAILAAVSAPTPVAEPVASTPQVTTRVSSEGEVSKGARRDTAPLSLRLTDDDAPKAIDLYVYAETKTQGVLKSGARVAFNVDGKGVRSFEGTLFCDVVLPLLAAHVTEISNAVEKVNRRALIGAYWTD